MNNIEIDNAVKKILQSHDEKVIAFLGRGYISSMVYGQGLTKAFMVLTDKRLYFVGREFGRSYSEKTIRTKSIKGADLVKLSIAPIRVLLGVLLLFAILCLIIGIVEGPDIAIIISAFVSLVVLLLIIFIKPQKVFHIRTSGEGVKCYAKLFSDDEIRTFRRKIMTLIEENEQY